MTTSKSGGNVAKLRHQINIEDPLYGASPSASAAVNTAAIHAAIAAAHAQGGGIVHVPAKTYAVSEITLGASTNVTLEGDAPGYFYNTAGGASKFSVTSGVFGVRIPAGSTSCGLKNLSIVSNGVVDDTVAPCSNMVHGVEYGVVIETDSTRMEAVNVYGFQYGCTIACAGNSNVFEQCSFVRNTRAGFVCTGGNAAGFALYHPNLVAGANVAVGTTAYTMIDCIIRRNGWGMILRDGRNPRMYNLLIESNLFGGLIEWVGVAENLSSTVIGGEWDKCFCENNWYQFDPALSWNTPALVGTNALLDSAGVPITLDSNATNNLSDFGYQITMGACVALAGSTGGPSYGTFFATTLAMSLKQKALLVKQGLLNKFIESVATGSTVAADDVKLGSGAYNANATHFYDHNGALPTAALSNRTMIVNSERSAADGGLTASYGYFRGLAGPVVAMATPTPITITDAAYVQLSNRSSLIANRAGTVTLTLLAAATYPGHWLHVKTIQAQTVVSAASDVVPLAGGAAGTAILAATAGAWAWLQSDGTNWIIMASN